MGRAQPPVAVQPVVGQLDQAIGAVIHVEQDRVEAGRRAHDHVVNVGHLERDARIGE